MISKQTKWRKGISTNGTALGELSQKYWMKYKFWFKGKWQQKYLMAYLKETPKQYIEVYYRIFISALFGEIF